MNVDSIGPKTSVHALLKAYPSLLDFLADYHPKFGLLRHSAMRATMGRLATLEQVAIDAPPGHPLHTYMAENREIMQAADRWAALCRDLSRQDPDPHADGVLVYRRKRRSP